MTKPFAKLPLDERIPLALTEAFTSSEVAAVRDAAEAALADANGKADVADVASLSPLATREQAVARRQEASDARWEAERLEASVAALSARVADLLEQERQAERAAHVAEVTAERDALAADIAELLPTYVRGLAQLARRIEETDQ